MSKPINKVRQHQNLINLFTQSSVWGERKEEGRQNKSALCHTIHSIGRITYKVFS